MKTIRMILAAVLAGLFSLLAVDASLAAAKGKLLFVPYDNCALADQAAVERLRSRGYEVLLPPAELLSDGAACPGQPDKLWAWVRANIGTADAAMVSADALLYGGLVPSRRHELPEPLLAARVAQFAVLHQKYPDIRFYVFGSLMRTSEDAAAGRGGPDYYLEYGDDIVAATALVDKQETQGLTRAEQAELSRHMNAVPPDVWQDWQARRDKNLSMNRCLIDYTRKGVVRHFVIGQDDTAPLSQTQREGRILTAYAQGLPAGKFQLLAGDAPVDAVLVCRAVQDLAGSKPARCLCLPTVSITEFYRDNTFET